VSKSALEGTKGLSTPAKCLEKVFQDTTHCYVGVFVSSI
jgi:hypothetical protein